MKPISALILLLVLITCGCKRNTYIIPEDELVNVLADIHMTEGLGNTNLRNFLTNRDRNKAIEKVIVSHGYNKVRFDSTMHYYALHSEDYELLYDRVIEELMLRESRIKAGEFDRSYIYKTLNLMKDYPEDTVLLDSILKEFWWVGRKVELDDESQWKGDYEMVFEDSLVKKGFVLNVDIHIFPNDSSVNPRSVLKASYHTDSIMGDSMLTDTVLLKKDTVSHAYSLYINTSDSLPVESIAVMFLDHDTSLNRKHALIDRIRLYELADPDSPEKQLPKVFKYN